MIPKNAPTEFQNRAILWNAVEQVEKAKNSQLAREIELALPVELTLLQNRNLVREYVKENFIDKGMCADICIHDNKDGNPHAHVLLTLRPFNVAGTWGEKSRKEYVYNQRGEKIKLPSGEYKSRKVYTVDWNEKTKAEEWRAAWAETTNHYLENSNHTERIDHRSYKRQGIEKIPTIHLGVAAHQMEQRGIKTDRGNINRAIEISNRKLLKLAEQINEFQGWLEEEKASPQPPTFADIISDILLRQGQGIDKSHISYEVLTFLRDNAIENYVGLEQHLKNLMTQQRQISHEFSPIRNRLTKLAEYINENDNYTKYKAQYTQYQQDYKAQLPWKKKAFEEDNRWIIENYNTAKRIMDKLRNKNNKIPLNSWHNEHSKLSAELKALDGKYLNLKNEIAQVNKIRIKVYDILRKERQTEQSVKSHDNWL